MFLGPLSDQMACQRQISGRELPPFGCYSAFHAVYSAQGICSLVVCVSSMAYSTYIMVYSED